MTDMPTSEEIDRMFDEGVDMTPYMDLESARMVPPVWTRDEDPVVMQVSIAPSKVVAIDRRARRQGQTRSEYVASLIDAALAT